MAGPPLIELENATLYRGSTRVFDDLTLTIEQGEQIAVLGPNGAGKSTLLKAINGELYPVRSPDTVFRILGKERWNVWALRKHIGLVSHDLHQRYTPQTTALEVVVSGYHSSIGVHGSLSHRVRDAEVRHARELLAEFGLADAAARPLAKLSTGQQRRCLLARALVHDPATLVFDEPTEGLDLAAGFDYLSRIRALSRQGRNILLVTHHFAELPPEIDRVILLSNGRIVADGTKRDVLEPARLSEVYGVPVRISEVDGYFLAYPGDPEPKP
jgi:iron complex transport system ATP-binding protein